MRLKALTLGIASALILTPPDIAAAQGEGGTPFLDPPTAPASARPQGVGRYPYLQPVPGSRLVSPWNSIVIRHANIIDRSTIDDRALTVVGSQSGIHTGRLVLSDDLKTLVYNPDQPFALGETVVVRLVQGVRALRGEGLPALSFSFTISAKDPKQQPALAPGELFPEFPAPAAVSRAPEPPPASRTVPPCDKLPPDYPVTPVLSSNDPIPGELFLAPFYGNIPGAYLLIVDHRGMPMFHRAIADGFGAFDFKRQPNGLLTYFLGTPDKYYAMDSSYTVVDSFATGNGYFTDLHDLQLLPDGHALLMSYDYEPVDMSAVVPGGNPKAVVIGLIVQELDAAKNVVFQWRSWDHFAITDLASAGVALTDSVIDYVHGNAIELDYDGNLLLSSRHMNEITKIDRQTGDIIWRLGLNAVNNQFTFENDTRGFSHQHDIRRLPNGHITLFDNGNYLAPRYSRAAEYYLDELNKVATLVWEYRGTPDVYGGFMGNAQRHADGTTTIGWGGTFSNPKLSDLHADGSKALEMGIEDSVHLWWSYRCLRFPWRTNRFATDVDSLDFGVVAVGSTVVRPLSIRNTTGSDITIGCFVTTDPAFAVRGAAPITLSPGSSATVDVEFTPAGPGEQGATLYARQVGDHELVAQAVAMRGTADGTTAVAGEGASRLRLEGTRPNPFGTVTTIGFALNRPEKVRLEIMDVRGRNVETLVNDVRAAGRHEVRWASKGRANGIYFCRLHAGDLVETRKIVLMR